MFQGIYILNIIDNSLVTEAHAITAGMWIFGFDRSPNLISIFYTNLNPLRHYTVVPYMVTSVEIIYYMTHKKKPFCTIKRFLLQS